MFIGHLKSGLEHLFRFFRNFETQISKKLVSVNMTTPFRRGFTFRESVSTYFNINTIVQACEKKINLYSIQKFKLRFHSIIGHLTQHIFQFKISEMDQSTNVF